MKHLKKIVKITFLILSATQLISCANNFKDPQDPYEKYNRAVFKFNSTLDKAAFRPVARTYTKVVPGVVQARVTNFFLNIADVPAVFNDILQLQPTYALKDSGRFVINSTLGVFGLFDVASKMNLPKHPNDFGLTLAYWGMQRSPYMVLPFFGPSTFRDSLADPVAVYTSPITYVGSEKIIYSAYALNKINQRAALLPADALVDDAFDPYVFVRDAYLQNRQNKINHMNPNNAAPNQDVNNAAINGGGEDTYVANNNDGKLNNNTQQKSKTESAESQEKVTNTVQASNKKPSRADENDQADLPTPMELTVE